LDVFIRDTNGIDIIGFDENRISDYAQAPNRLGLTDFQETTITNKLGTNTLNDIPAGKTLTDLLTAENDLTTRENQIKRALNYTSAHAIPNN
jgi:hypothetical protein